MDLEKLPIILQCDEVGSETRTPNFIILHYEVAYIKCLREKQIIVLSESNVFILFIERVTEPILFNVFFLQKKVSLHRIEHTDVTVELLCGKHVEVSCRSDAVASEIADVVMRHMNFSENSFFGLTILRGMFKRIFVY